VKLTGYAEHLSVAPGESVSFMVSTEEESFAAEIVRLFHGDRRPRSPGFKQEPVGSPVNGTYPGRRQETFDGSCGLVPGLPARGPEFALSLWVFPTTLEWPTAQCLVSRAAVDGGGFSLDIEGGHLVLRTGAGAGEAAQLAVAEGLVEGRWHFVYAGVEAGGGARIEFRTLDWPVVSGSATGDLPAPAAAAGTLAIAAQLDAPDARPTAHFNGKIAAPRLYSRVLTDRERVALVQGAGTELVAREALVGAWNLGSDPARDTFADQSGHGLSGKLVNRPEAAVTDHRWDGTVDWTTRPEHYEAVFFHSDDLADAEWEEDFRWEVPADLPSGVYAAWLKAGDREDHIPIVVRPPRDRATARVGVLMPTFTYLAYANERMSEEPQGFEESGIFAAIEPDPREAELGEHPEYGRSLYDLHADGRGVSYSSARRPILNLRPDYTWWGVRAPRHLGADLYLTDWLREKGFESDTFTDHDLHFDGVALLSRYKVIVTGGHPEYWSAAMLDALQAYLDVGGRLMYLGGNGFYWVTSVDPTSPHIIEIRRGYAGVRVWESEPGEYNHATTGERGGLWRHRGRSPNALVGVGFASQGFGNTAPGYERAPDASGPIADLVFEGVTEKPFGDYGLVMDGAGGDEVDRADPAYGTPAHAIVLASTTGHDEHYQLTVEDVMMTTPGLGGPENPKVRSDVVFMETPRNGAVFSAPAISWRASLSHNGYENDVSRITENVLRAFLEVEEWPG